MPDREVGCANCWPAEAALAWDRRGSLERDELIDDLHFGAAVETCRQCRQRFVSTFVEDVDWVDGDDPQYGSLMPITDIEATDLLNHKRARDDSGLRALPMDRTSLRSDYPKVGPQRVYWGSGVILP